MSLKAVLAGVVVLGALVAAEAAVADPVPYVMSNPGQVTECKNLNPNDQNIDMNCGLVPSSESKISYDPVSKILFVSRDGSSAQFHINSAETTSCYQVDSPSKVPSKQTSLSYCTPGENKQYLLVTTDGSVDSSQVVTMSLGVTAYAWSDSFNSLKTPFANMASEASTQGPALWAEVKFSGLEFSPAAH